jgi:hypothetical protein
MNCVLCQLSEADVVYATPTTRIDKYSRVIKNEWFLAKSEGRKGPIVSFASWRPCAFALISEP